MTNFQIYTAVDLKDGNCVRLVHGKENKMTIYEGDPIKQVKFFSNKGFKWVHIVDLNAAFGKYDNKQVILQILKQLKNNIKIQLGGGIRSVEDIKFWIDAGVSRIVLGTFAFNNTSKCSFNTPVPNPTRFSRTGFLIRLTASAFKNT